VVDVQAELAGEASAVARITAVARRKPSVCFGELIWQSGDLGPEWFARAVAGRDPGVRFESAARVIVFESVRGELRYWAGGGLAPGGNVSAEWKRIYSEGEERGVFPSVPAALAFTEAFLVRGEPIQAVATPRRIYYRRDTEGGTGELAAVADRPRG
jgi:hypothetical protein